MDGMPTDATHANAALLAVLPHLGQPERCAVACVSKELRAAAMQPSLWQVLFLQGFSGADVRLKQALSQSRFNRLQEITLEFAHPITDADLIHLPGQTLQALNLNACQQVTDEGVKAVASSCPNLKSLSLYWNLKITDAGITEVARKCTTLEQLNLSGCKSITDISLQAIASCLPHLTTLNLTRCVRISDKGMSALTSGACSLHQLYLYAVSTLTDKSLPSIACFSHLKLLDLCGMHHLSDSSLTAIAACHELTSINLTWCIRLTDIGVIALANGCHSLELLSLHGIKGITDASITALTAHCSSSLHTLDVNGCIGVKTFSRATLKQHFPNLICFSVQM